MCYLETNSHSNDQKNLTFWGQPLAAAIVDSIRFSNAEVRFPATSHTRAIMWNSLLTDIARRSVMLVISIRSLAY